MKKLYLLTCSYFVREMKMAIPEEYQQRIEVVAFPTHCGRLQLSWDEIAQLVPARESGAEVIIFGSSCTLGSNAPPAELAHCRILHLQQCFHLLCPPEIVDNALAEGSYLLSPGWLASWKKQAKDWGFNNDDSQSFLHNSVNTLLLLDTGVDPDITKKMQLFADNIGLPHKHLTIGLDYLKLLIQHEISTWQLKQLQQQHQDEQIQISNYAMSLNLLANLTQSTSELEVINGIFELFNMLFAPEKLSFFPIDNEVCGQARHAHSLSPAEQDAKVELPEIEGRYLWNESGNGFWLRLQHHNETMGLLHMEQFSMPQYKEAYLNMSLNIIDVCGLLIDNARIMKQLVDSAHVAGKAEVAIDVLHNVGNVLNSINTSTQIVTEKLQHSIGRRLTDVARLLNKHQGQLAEFLTSDPRGMKIPAFFSLLSQELDKERTALLDEQKRIFKHLGHVKAIIRTQQVYSRSSDLLERVSFEELFEEALQLYGSKIEQYQIKITREFNSSGAVDLQKQKLLQIIINLISNAIDSLYQSNSNKPHIILRLQQNKDNVVIEVEDNGIGIHENDMEHIFHHGFTTKPAHSGYGLHSSANLAAEMGGKLSCHSEGPGLGACFRLENPLNDTQREP